MCRVWGLGLRVSGSCYQDGTLEIVVMIVVKSIVIAFSTCACSCEL